MIIGWRHGWRWERSAAWLEEGFGWRHDDVHGCAPTASLRHPEPPHPPKLPSSSFKAQNISKPPTKPNQTTSSKLSSFSQPKNFFKHLESQTATCLQKTRISSSANQMPLTKLMEATFLSARICSFWRKTAHYYRGGVSSKVENMKSLLWLVFFKIYLFFQTLSQLSFAFVMFSPLSSKGCVPYWWHIDNSLLLFLKFSCHK